MYTILDLIFKNILHQLLVFFSYSLVALEVTCSKLCSHKMEAAWILKLEE